MIFKAEIPVSAQDISYAFIGVIEQGYDWFELFHAVDTPPTIEPWYADPKFFERDDFQIEVTTENPNDEGSITKTIGPADIQKGLTLMAKDYADDLADLVSESNGDANTYDVFMQLVVLGEIVYA